MPSRSRTGVQRLAGPVQVTPADLAALRSELVPTGEVVEPASGRGAPSQRYTIRGVPAGTRAGSVVTGGADVLVDDAGLAAGGVPVAVVERQQGGRIRLRVMSYDPGRGVPHPEGRVAVERVNRGAALRVDQSLIRLT